MNRTHIHISVVALLVAHLAFAGTEKVNLPSGGRLTILLERPKSPPDRPSRLCILIPPGPGTRQMAESAKTSLGRDLVKRGWVVAVPVSPNGKAFFGKNRRTIPALAALLQKRPYVAKGKLLLAGISNGGIAALEVAAESPKSFMGVVAVPGVLSRNVQIKKLRDVPIYLRVGAKDELKWGKVYGVTVKQLKKAGAKLDARLIPNAKHVFRVNWKQLGPWLKNLTPPGQGSAQDSSP